MRGKKSEQPFARYPIAQTTERLQQGPPKPQLLLLETGQRWYACAQSLYTEFWGLESGPVTPGSLSSTQGQESNVSPHQRRI
ncbi:hypothetical protein Trydic_g5822 [Trypoxylus dichotomus]